MKYFKCTSCSLIVDENVAKEGYFCTGCGANVSNFKECAPPVSTVLPVSPEPIPGWSDFRKNPAKYMLEMDKKSFKKRFKVRRATFTLTYELKEIK